MYGNKSIRNEKVHLYAVFSLEIVVQTDERCHSLKFSMHTQFSIFQDLSALRHELTAVLLIGKHTLKCLFSLHLHTFTKRNSNLTQHRATAVFRSKLKI